jgi:hypothetical protein
MEGVLTGARPKNSLSGPRNTIIGQSKHIDPAMIRGRAAILTWTNSETRDEECETECGYLV